MKAKEINYYCYLNDTLKCECCNKDFNKSEMHILLDVSINKNVFYCSDCNKARFENER